MLNDLSPKDQRTLHALPLLGAVIDDFSDWLIANKYRDRTRKRYLQRCVAIDLYFTNHQHHVLAELTVQQFRQCRQFYRHLPGEVADTVSCLKRYLLSRQLITADKPAEIP